MTVSDFFSLHNGISNDTLFRGDPGFFVEGNQTLPMFQKQRNARNHEMFDRGGARGYPPVDPPMMFLINREPVVHHAMRAACVSCDQQRLPSECVFINTRRSEFPVRVSTIVTQQSHVLLVTCFAGHTKLY